MKDSLGPFASFISLSDERAFVACWQFEFSFGMRPASGAPSY